MLPVGLHTGEQPHPWRGGGFIGGRAHAGITYTRLATGRVFFLSRGGSAQDCSGSASTCYRQVRDQKTGAKKRNIISISLQPLGAEACAENKLLICLLAETAPPLAGKIAVA